ncbi:glycosyltransferase [Mesobacterium sp. TK19101]|uniref:Glycosyltransferase n=1 Tax=Mesobacterium hydrothermale TaxID=3111907 RepID=A0ABU6HJ59_9RHOB|nr:glycosyltransferase [Mesobacterium sp. TK19101]MEC3861473.1 glycosyltransferase [Mesobacterium sp. TK19101]
MQVIGLCRFSYPAEGGFQVAHDSIAERIAYLYDPARLEDRFRHFETLCLPGLKAQTDPDFTLLILTGDSLPGWARDRLTDLCRDFPQARILQQPPMPHRKVCNTVLNDARAPGAPCLQFRHDDDDAVAVDFVARLRAAARDAAPLIARERHVAIDFNRGFVAEAGPDGICASESVHPFWGVALAMAVNAGVRQTIMNFAHSKMPRFMPSLSYTDSAMYVRGHNRFNDSRQGDKTRIENLLPLGPEAERLFADRFAIDCDQVRRAFATA